MSTDTPLTDDFEQKYFAQSLSHVDDVFEYARMQERENARLRDDLADANEQHRMELAAISAACFANSRTSAPPMEVTHPYWTQSYQDAVDAVAREMNQRERAEQAEAELADYKLWAEVEIADLRDDGKRLNKEIAELQNAFEDSVTALELAEQERDKHFAASKAQNEDITSLQAKLATCKADADRYRWLRDMNNDEAAVKLFSAWCGQNLDENIDAAIKVSLK